MSSVVFVAQDALEYRSRIMSEFSSGAFKPFGSGAQFVLPQQKFGVRAPAAEDESYQDVKWRVQDNMPMDGDSSDHSGFRSWPDSALSLSSSSSAHASAPCATFDHFNVNEHENVVVNEMFSSREAPAYEPSMPHSLNLQYLGSSSPAQLDELYGGYHGGRWQAAPDPNGPCNSSDVLVVVPGNTQDTTKPLTYHLASSNTSCDSSADSFSFQKFSPHSTRLSAASGTLPGSMSGAPLAMADSLGQNNKATAPFRNSFRPPTADLRRFQARGRGRGDFRAAASTSRIEQQMSLGMSSQSLAANYHQALRVAKTPTDFTLGKRQLNGSRVPDMLSGHLEHVQRERQRRDDMSAKIATLETLLPPASKRDRVSIVHDGIHYVRALQEKVKALQGQLQEAKRRAEAGAQDKKWSCLGSSSNVDFASSSRNLSSSRAVLNASRTSGRFRLGPMTRTTSTTSFNIGGTQSGRAEFEGSGGFSDSPLLGLTPKSEPLPSRGPISVELHVQVDRPGEQVQVVKCECRYSYLSSVMRTLDQLQLSLHRCSVTKLHDYVICVIVIKPTSNCSTAHAVSSAQIATLLKIAAVDS
ncbi:protein MpBHLH5 [Marchantia polymorpha subsp. ruderalis]|uniref:BHLH domain-containing protein n=2 Tax=Marchantia polymorpha TaxID=3197 RepID=A0A176WD64_MARPO|nr:hypothetical protein AXG93_4031s1070 [Marchantia polymorpha subsp. ruderalis]PTQ41380.1 hypothetical protein MARPO_0035s0146 [Marchantia polymorpha]PTQ41381.1 hypothetical protein MARPO_0035s0146 [Marchantia polymorpha]PTQ41382.1 hypothetical protein MARPO_0035s0146 [Marchantia polymorpha]BBN13460.1 hypothetical protein Mp_6g03670 [Marchantia polymorpha subsp. ruderalis]|eukprot:PTQ41380.1 hypothetical protein MARPO_0035s0146 [Marchantia polymorpha]